jgi:iron complex outermembrane recepter protein
VSQTYGYNRLKYNISNTLNASIANLTGKSPNKFDAGGFSFDQATTNIDFTRFFDGIAEGMNVALGGEYRRENYSIFAGEPGSYIDADGLGVGGIAGSQGFPGFQPIDVTDKKRSSIAAYLDVETDITKAFKLQTALRSEHFNDFGSTTIGKLAASLKANEQLLFRASASTGFRAPALQQINFSSTFTDFISNQPTEVKFAPNGSVIPNFLGIPPLKEEKSKSVTLGFTLKPSRDTAVTADLYNIDIKDRIVLSGRFNEGNYPALGPILTSLGVLETQFFVNSAKTRTQGLDLTVSNKSDLAGGKLSTYLAVNFSKTEVKSLNVPPKLLGSESILLSEKERLYIEQGGPRRKATLDFDYTIGSFNTDFKIIHFGPQTLGTFTGTAGGEPNAYYKSKTSADLSFTYSIDPTTKITVGGNNIFNVKPTEQNANETDNSFKYESVQFGLNGASYFARLWKKF